MFATMPFTSLGNAQPFEATVLGVTNPVAESTPSATRRVRLVDQVMGRTEQLGFGHSVWT